VLRFSGHILCTDDLAKSLELELLVHGSLEFRILALAKKINNGYGV